MDLIFIVLVRIDLLCECNDSESGSINCTALPRREVYRAGQIPAGGAKAVYLM